jgi:hypothetical protein
MPEALVPIPDTIVTFNNSLPFYYRTTSTPNPAAAIKPTEFDFLAEAEHEIDQALGIGSTLTCIPSITHTCSGLLPNIVEPLDLFRYDMTSTKLLPVRSFTLNTSARAFFSIDGDVVAGIPGIPGAPGTTPEFNNQDVTADFHDWVTGTGVQDAVGPSGRIANLGPNEIRALDVIGYDLVGATPPAPATPGPVTHGGVILSPTGAVVDLGGTATGSDIRDIINQNGLAYGFLSGITDFDSYLTSTPPPGHTVTAAHFEWFSTSNIARVTFDLGKMYSVERLAVWEEENRGTGTFDLYYSTDGLTFVPLAYGLTPNPNVYTTGSYEANVFSFPATNTRYIRLDMPNCLIPYGSSLHNTNCSIGEVAFEVNPSPSPVASSVTLTPLSAINDVGANHTVTATATSTGGAQAPGETVNFTILTGPNAGQTAEATTDGNGRATLTYTDAGGAGTDTIRATIRNLASNIVSKTWLQCGTAQAQGELKPFFYLPLVLCLAPATATNYVNSTHTVTATAVAFNEPKSGIVVTFTVLTGPNAGKTGTATTNIDGQASFTYVGSGGAGTDTIQATYSFVNLIYSSNIVSKTWTYSVVTGVTGAVECDPSGAAFLRIINTGSGPAMNVVLASLITRTLTGSGSVVVNAPSLPYTVGSVPVGGSVMVPLTLNVPSTVRRFSLTENGTVQDAAGKSYSYSLSQVLQH